MGTFVGRTVHTLEVDMTLAGDPDWDMVKLLIGPTGADGSTTIVDESSSGATINVVGNAQVDTGNAKFSRALLLDGTGDWCWVAAETFLPIGTNDPFTMETWAYLNPAGSGIMQLVSSRPLAGTPISYVWQVNPTNRSMGFAACSDGFSFNINFGSAVDALPTNGTWFHAAVTKTSARVFKMWVNGVQVGTQTPAVGTIPDVGDEVGIGARSSLGAEPLNGALEDIRITVGKDRYTDTFTPPSERFPRE